MDAARVAANGAAPSGPSWKVSSGGGRVPRWHPRGTALFYTSRRALMSVSTTLAPAFRTGTPRVVFTVDFDNMQFDVAPDGSRFLVLRQPNDETSRTINLITGFDRLIPAK